jgi:hypothetical protein
MRFVVTGEWNRNTLLRVIVLFFLFYSFAFWLTNFGLYFFKMGLTYQSVVDYYRGSAEQFTQPRSLLGLLEVSHFHLFAMGIFLVTLTHLLLFVPVKTSLKLALIVSAFTSAFLDEMSSWLVRFVSPLFAYLKIGSFVVLQASLLVTIILATWAVLTMKPSAYSDSNARPRQG